MRRIVLIGLLCYAALLFPQTSVQIISYNVENLFHPSSDSLHNDYDFTPEGNHHWTFARYREKLAHIGQVVANIGGWNTPALIGLEEIENEQCLIDLCRWGVLSNYKYQYLHHDSPDERGIDCALLYQPKQFKLLAHTFLPVPTDNRPTRDIVYACGQLHNNDTLHIFLCHFPSQRGGTTATNSRRAIAQATLQTALDSLLQTQPTAKIVVMGDFNMAPAEQFAPLHNLMLDFEAQGKGTYKWHGVWSCLDHFYVSQNILPYVSIEIFCPAWLLQDDLQYLDKKPFRTYQGYKYIGGYSDHLPIYLTINIPQ